MKRPDWYPTHLALKPIIKRLSNEEAGKVYKMSLDAFDDGTVPEADGLSEMGQLAIELTLGYQTEALQAYQQKVEAGRRGGLKKAENQKQQKTEEKTENSNKETDVSEDDRWTLPF